MYIPDNSGTRGRNQLSDRAKGSKLYSLFFWKYNLHHTRRTNNDKNNRFYGLPVGIEGPKEGAGGAIVDNWGRIQEGAVVPRFEACATPIGAVALGRAVCRDDIEGNCIKALI